MAKLAPLTPSFVCLLSFFGRSSRLSKEMGLGKSASPTHNTPSMTMLMTHFAAFDWTLTIPTSPNPKTTHQYQQNGQPFIHFKAMF
ncbi:hypothetical protein GVN20_05915 [Runella sp. CRIBMP]|uniref:hypothetical protein n=1 Tax=Runella sp. CRIBMP TaxID=2683261 RepID=UPI0014130AB2|nr:hypothetical protein [Runella sp. CRIBMP]NBB18886.1 hypothetical protein [Runella sp. CRIBMP]